MLECPYEEKLHKESLNGISFSHLKCIIVKYH